MGILQNTELRTQLSKGHEQEPMEFCQGLRALLEAWLLPQSMVTVSIPLPGLVPLTVRDLSDHGGLARLRVILFPHMSEGAFYVPVHLGTFPLLKLEEMGRIKVPHIGFT